MAIEIERKHEFSDLSDLNSELLDENDDNNSSYSKLCVPQDRLEDVEFFLNFKGELIPVNNLLLTPEHGPFIDETCGGDIEDNNSSNNNNNKYGIVQGNITKKPRSKRSRGNTWPSFWRLGELETFDHYVGLGRVERQSLKSRHTVGKLAKRRCSHCQTEKTPQWREGPMGARSLCNACGVRYKSGRLLPEYRPAASPTFDIMKHSNFHRQIKRMRNEN